MADMTYEELARGRTLYAQGAWVESYESLERVDREASLAPEDLELLATAAYMSGRDDEQLSALERVHQAYLDRGERLRAVRCAVWLGVHLMLRGEVAHMTGWFRRAQRLLEKEKRDCVEQGYLLIATDLERRALGDWEAATSCAAAAAKVAERFGDADLLALALMNQGGYLVRLERVEEGLGKLDEAMVAAMAGELSPIVTGLVYCGVIDGCREVHELRRASEWTAVLTRWCDRQPGLVPFTGTCLVHRAELMQIGGDWRAALEEARLARERFLQRSNDVAAGLASYRQGEVLRLRGDLAAAEQAYREASRRGYEPQPGLALLLVAQNRIDAAVAAIDQVMAATTERVELVRLLPACVEIMLAAGESGRARSACVELEGIAASYGSAMLRALAAYARGAVELAGGDARGALVALRRARKLWQELDAPYESARARVLLARACRMVGDEETAVLELGAARAAFDGLGAAPDLAFVDSLEHGAVSSDSEGLTARELQVLRLLAAGESNKAIAAELVLSKRTVDRHVSNIFGKLRVSTRAAATAYAYQHELI
jgi:DNA-binding CsgD family transcriptional regulator